MEREDFNNNVDWVVYKVTGRLPNSNTVELKRHTLQSSDKVNELKFYTNRQNERFGCLYNNNFLCSCEKDEIKDVQKYFDEHYTGNNLEEVRESLKDKYNITKRNQTYKNGALRFSKKGKRLTAYINHEKVTHTICSCYPNQKEEVTEKFNTLRKTRDLESIKETMKRQYNLQGRLPTNSEGGVISVDKNGTIYKDGKLCKVDPKMYQFINNYIMEE